MARPTEPSRREAPINATDRGSRKPATAAAAAIRSRCSNSSRASGVRDVGNSTTICPGSIRVSTGNPESRNTCTIAWFSGMTFAVNVVIPLSSAAAAR